MIQTGANVVPPWVVPDLSPDVSKGRWHVLHVKSRQEKAVCDDLSAAGVRHFLPLVRSPRYYGRRKAIVDLPLFPAYVFLFGSTEQAWHADRTKRVARIINVADQHKLDRELRNIHLALNHGAPLDPYPHLTKGLRVIIRSGPFAGVEGVIERREGRHRLVLQLQMLGAGASMEIDPGMVEPVT